jgi:3-hydroxymyristoyl/3-hydroxydecanoyl-(acyl carrier protein) dehydratase
MSAATPVVTEPDVIETRRSEKGVELELRVPRDLMYFKGHFPGFPVLPGVVQLHWAIALGQRYFDLGTASPEVVQVKFRSVIIPAERIRLALGHDASRRRLSFEYRDATAARSSGVVSFAA